MVTIFFEKFKGMNIIVILKELKLTIAPFIKISKLKYTIKNLMVNK